jgi:transposase
MPKSNYLATPVKKAIVSAKDDGQTDRAVAQLFNINQATVSRIYKRHRQENNVSRRAKEGRPRKIKKEQESALVRPNKLDKNKSATDVVDRAREVLGMTISQRTAQRILKRNNLLARRPAAKPLLTERHRMARLRFAIQYREWTAQDWGKVLWSDESKMNIFNSDCGNLIRRPKSKRLDPRYIRSTVKFGAGNIMVWGTHQNV